MNSPHQTDQENVWFVDCSTTARATPASGEGALEGLRSDGKKMGTVRQLITPHVDIVTHIGEVLQNPEIISNCLIYSRCM